MASVQELQKIIHRFVKQSGEPRFQQDHLEEFAQKYARRFVGNQPDLALLLGEHRTALIKTGLETLEANGIVELSRDDQGAILAIHYTGFYSREVMRRYLRMADDRDLLFPAEEDLDITIPASQLRTVDVADNLMHWIQSEDEDPMQILLLRFPEGVRSMVITVQILKDNALGLILAKVRDYLRTDRNASYIETKLRAIFRGREVLVHEIIETAQIRPDDALESIRKPNEFQFHFWTQLSSIIIKEYAKKNEKLDMEHAFCQAAYLLGYYSVLHKGNAQKQQQVEETHKLLTTCLQKPPYVFSIQDVYGFTDDQKIPITKKISRNEINQWIEELLQRPSEKEISELVTINTPESSGLMVHSSQYVPLLRRQLKAASAVMGRGITNTMVKLLFDEQDEDWMTDDGLFEKYVAKLVQDDFPLLHGLAQFKTLFLVVDGSDLPPEQRDATMELIDRKNTAMKPWTVILQLDRSALYRDARLQLPVWMVVPILRGIVRLLRRMFSSEGSRRARAQQGKSVPTTQEKTDDSESKEARRAQFREAVEKMQAEYLSPGQTASQRLQQLQKAWNPLIDPTAHNNLVEDVNALCRDALRKLRYTRTLQPPDPDRIGELATRIASNSAFERIRRRKEFETYLRLYMLVLLQRA